MLSLGHPSSALGSVAKRRRCFDQVAIMDEDTKTNYRQWLWYFDQWCAFHEVTRKQGAKILYGDFAENDFRDWRTCARWVNSQEFFREIKYGDSDAEAISPHQFLKQKE